MHALDRTGPPVLALGVARCLRAARPHLDLSFLAFRGGPMEAALSSLGPVRVVLDDEEPWDVRGPDRRRADVLTASLAELPPVDVNLLVSVAAGQVLPLVPQDLGPVVTWAVEIGEDLHWLDDPVGLADRTDRWWAGSSTTLAELERRLPGARIEVIPEFVEDPPTVPSEARSAARRALGADQGDLLVVGAGIGTYRKGLDLFVETAIAHRRSGGEAVFAWIGGERDPLPRLLREDLLRPEFDHIRILPSVADLDPHLAAADVLLHPARLDAFPLVCIQSALVGTPVVGFQGAGGLAEMFGPEAQLAPYPDVRALSEVLQRTLEPARRRAVGAAQASWVRARSTASVAGPRLAAALADVADAGRPGSAR